MKYLCIILALIIVSCGPSAKLRRAKRLIAQAEAQGAVWSVDTVFKTVDIPVAKIERDTVVLNTPGDTIVITQDKLRVKIKVIRDSIYVKGECLPDTVRVSVPVTVTKTIEAKRGVPWWVWLLLAIGFMAGVWIGAKLFRR